MDDDTNDDCQRVFERGDEGELEPTCTDTPHGENAVVDDYDGSTDDLSKETQDVVDNMDVESNDSATDEHPDTFTIRVPLDDRHGGMVSDIQDAGVSVEQQFIEDREFMAFVDQRIHGLFSSLKYSEGGEQR